MAALLVVYLGYLAVMLAYGRSVLMFPFDYDQGEGFELYDAVRLARFENIYLDNARFPFYSSNYPPVYRVLLVPLVWLFGPHLWVGRIVALAATLVIGAGIMFVARAAWRTEKHVVAWLVPAIAGLAFFAANYVYQVAPLARAHLPMAAFAFFGIAALARAFRDEHPHAAWAAAGVTLLMTAGFTKLQAVDALCAGFAFLLARNPRWFLQALVGCAAATVVLVGWIDLSSQGQFWINVVAANVNEYDIAVTWKTYGQWLQLQWPTLVCAALYVAWNMRDAIRARSLRSIDVWSLYFLMSSAIGMLTGKWGAGPTYLIASIAAALVCTALLFVRVWRTFDERRRTWIAAVIVAVFTAQAAANLHMPTSGRVFGAIARAIGLDAMPSSYPPYPYYDSSGYTQLGHLLDQQDAINAWALVEELRKHPGPLLTEEAMLSLNAGREVVTNPTQLLNLSKNDMLDTTEIIERIDRREFGAIVLKAFFYPEDVKEAFGRSYRMVGSIRINGFDYYLLLPKTS